MKWHCKSILPISEVYPNCQKLRRERHREYMREYNKTPKQREYYLCVVKPRRAALGAEENIVYAKGVEHEGN